MHLAIIDLKKGTEAFPAPVLALVAARMRTAGVQVHLHALAATVAIPGMPAEKVLLMHVPAGMQERAAAGIRGWMPDFQNRSVEIILIGARETIDPLIMEYGVLGIHAPVFPTILELVQALSTTLHPFLDVVPGILFRNIIGAVVSTPAVEERPQLTPIFDPADALALTPLSGVNDFPGDLKIWLEKDTSVHAGYEGEPFSLKPLREAILTMQGNLLIGDISLNDSFIGEALAMAPKGLHVSGWLKVRHLMELKHMPVVQKLYIRLDRTRLAQDKQPEALFERIRSLNDEVSEPVILWEQAPPDHPGYPAGLADRLFLEAMCGCKVVFVQSFLRKMYGPLPHAAYKPFYAYAEAKISYDGMSGMNPFRWFTGRRVKRLAKEIGMPVS